MSTNFLRDRLGLSQRQMADLLQISPFQFALYETGRQKKLEDSGKIIELNKNCIDYDPAKKIYLDESPLNSELNSLEALQKKIGKEIRTIQTRLFVLEPLLEKQKKHFQSAENLMRTVQFLRKKNYLKDRPTLLEVDYMKSSITYGNNCQIIQDYHSNEIQILKENLTTKKVYLEKIQQRCSEIKTLLSNLTDQNIKV
jgi:transcriptional regulator with XRE-family HTH domain